VTEAQAERLARRKEAEEKVFEMYAARVATIFEVRPATPPKPRTNARPVMFLHLCRRDDRQSPPPSSLVPIVQIIDFFLTPPALRQGCRRGDLRQQNCRRRHGYRHGRSAPQGPTARRRSRAWEARPLAILNPSWDNMHTSKIKHSKSNACVQGSTGNRYWSTGTYTVPSRISLSSILCTLCTLGRSTCKLNLVPKYRSRGASRCQVDMIARMLHRLGQHRNFISKTVVGTMLLYFLPRENHGENHVGNLSFRWIIHF
jgi:hypothetical protein